MILSNLPQAITAIGGLGTAAFGLLDAVKPVFPAINHTGFARIRMTILSLTPSEAEGRPPLNSLPQSSVLDTLLANWINGTDLASQKSIAKSLIKLHMSAGNAASLAASTNVDPALLTEVAKSIASGTALTQQQGDAYARFDLIATAMIDEAYQHADQVYRNTMRALAAVIAVVLAFAGGLSLMGSWEAFWWKPDMFLALLIGLLATPMAPIAKDIASALSTAVNAMQMVKK